MIHLANTTYTISWGCEQMHIRFNEAFDPLSHILTHQNLNDTKSVVSLHKQHKRLRNFIAFPELVKGFALTLFHFT